MTSGTLDIYESGASLTKLYSVTPTEGSGGTDLGATDGTGDLNHWHRAALGHNRWKTSNLRQWLNSTGEKGAWWSAQEKWDVAPAQSVAYDGFLRGIPAEVLQYCKVTKVQTICNSVIDGGAVDITYDRVFLASLEQMYAYAVPQVAGVEGDYWEYYKRLLGRTTPAPVFRSYARLIKYALDAQTSASPCWTRSAFHNYGCVAWIVYANGGLSTGIIRASCRCAPCLRIGL